MKRPHCKAFNETSGNWLARIREIPCMGKPVTPKGYCQKHAHRDTRITLEEARRLDAKKPSLRVSNDTAIKLDRMSRTLARSIKAHKQLDAAKKRWEFDKRELQKSGLWEEFCNLHNYPTDIEFKDLAA